MTSMIYLAATLESNDTPEAFAAQVKHMAHRLYTRTRVIPTIIEVKPGTVGACNVETMKLKEVQSTTPGHVMVGGEKVDE